MSARLLLFAAALTISFVVGGATRAGGGKDKGPAKKAEDIIGPAKKNLATQREIAALRAKNDLASRIELGKLAAGQMEERITPAFVAASRAREIKISDEERKLLKLLDSTISVDFKGTSFRDAIEYFNEKVGLRIFVDKQSMDDVGLEYESQVTLKLKLATVRTALKKILADRKLTYVIKQASIQVVTPEKAREDVVTRVYPIRDLMPVVDMRYGPFANRVQMYNTVYQLIGNIVNNIEPETWAINDEGGRGSIIFYEPTQSLIVRNTAEFHYQMRQTLRYP